MVPNAALIDALRSLNYTFKRQTERVDVYKKRGDTRRSLVRKNASHTPEYARSVLRLAGMNEEEIERFLSQANN